MMGLFAFFYATAHLVIFFAIDIELQWAELLEGIVERPYITVGFLSWLLLVPLAITSTKGWIRRLGGARWNRLHRLIYVIAVGGTVHYLWSVKKDLRPPLVYAAIFALLFAARLVVRRRAARARPAGAEDRAARSAREDRAHPPRELVEGEGLLEEVDPASR